MSKAARQRSARERLAEERKKQAAKQQRTRALMISLSALVIVALAVVITVYFVNKKDPNAPYAGPFAPASRQTDGAVLAAAPGAKAPKLEIFEDFQCPICHEFEKASGDRIKKLAAEGKVTVAYYPFWLFKQQTEPIRGNSQRAANAALCAPADKWVQYHDAIYKHQPAEGSKGFSNKDLIGWAKDLGIATPEFQQCVNGGQKQSMVDQMTTFAEQTRKVSGTPTVFLNGQQLDLSSTLLNANNLEKAITSAKPADVTPSTSAPASPSATPKK